MRRLGSGTKNCIGHSQPCEPKKLTGCLLITEALQVELVADNTCSTKTTWLPKRAPPEIFSQSEKIPQSKQSTGMPGREKSEVSASKAGNPKSLSGGRDSKLCRFSYRIGRDRRNEIVTRKSPICEGFLRKKFELIARKPAVPDTVSYNGQ